MYDFDTIIERRGTGCLKYDTMQAEKGRDDLLSLWVADMDFPVPQEVIEAIHARADHGIFGYNTMTDAYRETVCSWFSGIMTGSRSRDGYCRRRESSLRSIRQYRHLPTRMMRY